MTDIACIPGFDKQEFRSKFPGLSADDENLAWTKYISDMVLALRAECEKTPILMAHYTVPGCNMESGQTSFFTNFEPVIPREALMAARYEAVLLGHIHRPQIIEGFDNVFYSGAINAMNFNDEGQDRGFWIHEFNEKGTLIKGHRYTTPYRQFRTITWDSDEVGNYIREGVMYLHRTGIPEEVADKIVRVRYSCTSEQKKALNIPLLQKNLYEVGAWVQSEKQKLAMVMRENEIEWDQKGTHEQHLSVLDYKKKVREQEVEELTEHKNLLEHDLHDISECVDEIQKEKAQAEKERDAVIKKTEVLEKRFSALNSKAGLVDSHAREYGYYPEEWLPEAGTLESAKSYRKRIFPLVKKVANMIQALYSKYLDLKNKNQKLSDRNIDLENRVDRLREEISVIKKENVALLNVAYDMDRVVAVLGENKVKEHSC